jgi:hypothetical protein
MTTRTKDAQAARDEVAALLTMGNGAFAAGELTGIEPGSPDAAGIIQISKAVLQEALPALADEVIAALTTQAAELSEAEITGVNLAVDFIRRVAAIIGS